MSQNIHVDLSPVLRTIDRLESNLSVRIDSVHGEVGNVRNDLRLTSSELRELKMEFERFVTQADRRANIQQSETRIVNLKQELNHEFGHYDVVRRTSTGMLQAFDVGNVTHDTVRAVSEELMIQTPRYWLAPALVALAAWSRDEQVICEKSVQEAFSRDKNKTSLLFALVLRRQGRTASAVRWLRHYLASLDPTKLTREFAVILEASSYDAFGSQGQQLMSDQMAEWCAMLRDRPDIVENQVQAWESEIAGHRQRVDQRAYAQLAHLAPKDWQAWSNQIESASALPQVIQKYESVQDTDLVLPKILEDLLDDILDQLVTEYDEEELPMRREVLFHESVIARGGDIDQARQLADGLQAALDETTDVVTMQTRSAISPELIGVGVQTQRIAIGVGQQDFSSAVGRYCVNYRQRAIDGATFLFGTDHSNFASTYSFRGCNIKSTEPEQHGIARLTQTWEETFAAHIETLRFKSQWYLVPALIVAGIALVLGLMAWFLGLIAVIVGAAVVYFMGEKRRQRAEVEIGQAREAQAQALATSVSLYRDAAAQLVDARLVFQELDQAEGELLRVIGTWPTASTEGVAR